MANHTGAWLSDDKLRRLQRRASSLHKTELRGYEHLCSADDLLSEAITYISETRPRDADGVPLDAKDQQIGLGYICEAMRNHADKLRRRAQREARYIAQEEALVGGAAPQAPDATRDEEERHAAACLQQRSGRLRALLDDLRWSRSSREKTDFWGLLLIRVRVGAARELWRVLRDANEALSEAQHAASVTRLIPWRDDEARIEMRERWPALATLGDALLCELRARASFSGASQLAAVNAAQVVEVVKKSSWDKWAERAWDRASEALTRCAGGGGEDRSGRGPDVEGALRRLYGPRERTPRRV